MKDEIVCSRCGARIGIASLRVARPSIEYCTIGFDEDDVKEFSMGQLITLCPSCVIDFDTFMSGKA